jgi:hypothetical protein
MLLERPFQRAKRGHSPPSGRIGTKEGNFILTSPPVFLVQTLTMWQGSSSQFLFSLDFQDISVFRYFIIVIVMSLFNLNAVTRFTVALLAMLNVVFGGNLLFSLVSVVI